ncbi:two-component response regulator ORR1 [Dendrobium catenatum]|uniref:Two-component response regulator ARR8 n=1 Tax=Dendrobium catenatum TaxID=906689 RepID=A0A2I0VMW5_9ASPA|nr:two-component response regulator ORR1 [Dendrobium catenatum]PKU64751.1 Two-component response regulator ARR8 [Dendrobium catenatum]
MMASPLFLLLALALYFSPLKKQQIVEHILKVSEAAMEKMKGEIGEEERSNCDNQGDGKLKVRILVVDDSLLDRKVVERLLNKSEEGFEVITVDNGKKAMDILGLNEAETELAAINDQSIDIVLTDYCMPGMTGYDLLKAVKGQSFRKPIPVVVMSSENEPQRISRCRAIGAEDFILKPIQIKDVQRLRNYAKPNTSSPIVGSKRKMKPLELATESGGSEKRPRLAGVVVA